MTFNRHVKLGLVFEGKCSNDVSGFYDVFFVQIHAPTGESVKETVETVEINQDIYQIIPMLLSQKIIPSTFLC